MFTYVFIDWENIEKTTKQDYGSIIVYDEFVKVIKEIAAANGSRLLGINAYGDFDKGNAGLMSKLINLGVEPHHVVTKTSQEYLKGSTDIELALDILETMYNYPHITDFLFISGDLDLRHVITRLRKHGKNLRIMGYKANTSSFLKDMVNEFIPLDDYENIMRKVTQSEKEQKIVTLLSNKYVQEVIVKLDIVENEGRKFVGLNNLRKRLIDYHQENITAISEALTDCLDFDIVETYSIDNPKDPKHPTTACKLNRNNEAINQFISTSVK